MQCAELQIQNRLSAFFDNELPHASHKCVAEHVESCTECSRELSSFARLSALVHQFPVPQPPEGGWSRIAAAIDTPLASTGSRARHLSARSLHSLLLVAASLLLVLGAGWATHWWRAPEHHHALAMEQYLGTFSENPMQAQQLLLAAYPTSRVDMAGAAGQLGYRPAIARGLPQGYSIEATYVMDMPCCRCVQTLCRRNDGSQLAVFEHDKSQPSWFAGRACVAARCGGKECAVFRLDRHLCVSFQHGPRHLTIVGAHDLQEVTRLVTALRHGQAVQG